MGGYDNSYSRLVAGLKIILPLLALALLSTLFLVSRPYEPNRDLPFSDPAIEGPAPNERLVNLAYSGVSKNGSAVTITAKNAQPIRGSQQIITAQGLQSTIKASLGQTVEITAPDGTFDGVSQIVLLENGVVITTSTGYQITTKSMRADLNVDRLSTIGQVIADGPVGHLTAGQMVLQQQPGDGSQDKYELIFKNGVELVYTPQTQDVSDND